MKKVFNNFTLNWNKQIEYLLCTILLYFSLVWLKNETLIFYKVMDNLNTWNDVIIDNRLYLIIFSLLIIGLVFIRIDKKQYMRHFKTPILIASILGFLISTPFFSWYFSFMFFISFIIFQLDFSETKNNSILIYDSR